MKPRPWMALVGALGLATGAHAQWAVYDAVLHKQQILDATKEIAKYVEMIDNQVKHLKTLEAELATLRRYVEIFGTPDSVKPASIPEILKVSQAPEAGTGLEALLEAVDAEAGMEDRGHGVFDAIGKTFETSLGTTITRAPELYRAFAALRAGAENFLAVAATAARHRATLKAEIARTATALSKAATDAEVQKLGGVMVGLGSLLQSAELELRQATDAVLVLEINTRADERRQTEARKERLSAEFAETFEQYGKTFRLVSRPIRFP